MPILPDPTEIPVVLKRLVKPPTLDFETALWEIFYLLFAPRRVYKQLYYRKQTKNRWSRDDPSFVILLVFFLTVSAVAWGLAYTSGAVAILRMVLYMVVIDFLATGFAIATVGWLLANRLFKKSSPATIGGVSDEELEWAFCFDIHCNSFLIIWVSLYLVQFVLLPVLTLDNWLSLFLGNTMYFGALSYYFVITFYGYNALPFLEHTEMILFPIPVVAALYLCSLFGFSMVKHMSSLYFN
ncbi:hypothetical protein BABINDRAFT_179637 [Babjeviella inositovora NRRL Y-12698]|uniref:UNC-50 family protein n=1 Tax=Babjeviella inositovora NRRL Y-12698 TaxID=984486 RepID=A0A1E3QTK9_9ASCO|nr:uncharacterized protein BABINDRAFT_179637 [Babjeviella inositovora NRRL Y-12698]ODQ80990.1 hypothetical protein BABINDRAFT_179637 [Babjeviella inositovora NRRL Y-12698]